MPDFKFYFTQAERIELIDYLLKERFIIVNVKEYAEQNYDIITSIEDFNQAYSRNEIRFFLLRDDFTFEKLEFIKISSRPFYFINQRVGGPYIDLTFYLGYADDDYIKYKSSWIRHYPRYIHIGKTDEYKVPDNLKAAYSKILKFIKSKTKTVKVKELNFTVSKSILSELEL
jgi:hypothetical protein